MAEVLSETRLYGIWHNMLQRCENKNNKAYSWYGAKGITVCEEWHSSKVFCEWALANGYSDNLTIDRIDNSKGYYPENCRWADYLVQGNNTSRNHLITMNGETHTVAEWARIKGLPYKLIYRRTKDCGMSFEDALTRPVRKIGKGLLTLTCNGETKTVIEWAKQIGCNPKTLYDRKSQGWSDERIILEKIKRR